MGVIGAYLLCQRAEEHLDKSSGPEIKTRSLFHCATMWLSAPQQQIKADSSVNEYWTRHTRQRNRQVTRKIYEQTPLSIRTARKITMTFHFVLRSTRHDQKSTISHPRAEMKFFAASPASFARAEPPRSVGGRWCAQTHLRICWQGGVQLLRIVEVMCHLYRECINKSNILINAASYKNSCLS